ncbi:MAG: hypothetical protein IKK24_02740, partial [Clostridia bacterium]|nr:hypothetical protein [Clostridia bacterium]
MTRDEVRSWNIAWDSNNHSSLKEQLRGHLAEINEMEPVATVVYNKKSKKPYYQVLDEILRDNFGYKIQRKEYGTITFSPGTIEGVRNYVNNDAEAAAIISAPYVLKRGKAITGHKNHKDTENVSVTFAAPVVINKQIGNVAVCVMYGKGTVHSLRVLTPEGKTFELLKIENTESTITGRSTMATAEPYIDSVSNNSISNFSEKGKENFENNSQDKIRRSVPIKENDTDATDKPEILDYTARHQELFEEFQNGEITAEEYKEMVDVLFKSAGEEKGTIPKGETVTGKENFDNPVPLSVNDEGNTQRYVRTVLEGGQLTEEMVHSVKQQILSGEFAYEPTSNEANFNYAKQAVEKNTAESIWEKAVNGDGLPNKNEIAIGEALLKQAIQNNDAAKVIKYTAELADMGTRLGQSVQALSLLKRMDGLSQLVYVKRAVDTLNNDLQKRFKAKATIVQIDENMATRLAQSKTKADIELTYGAIMNDIAAQVPATFLDKWNAWRYMAMLSNPTTHIRNLTGNSIFVPAISIKNILAATAEKAFVKTENRTKSVVIKKSYKEFAGKDFEKVAEVITGGGKMNPKTTIADNKPIFKTKALEKLRKFNFDLLEKEDVIFLKKHYKTALAGFLQARNVDLSNVSDEILSAAREYAILEAQKATYRDANGIANAIQRFSGKNAVINLAIEGILPFKKTPMNIIRRGIDYSPIGIIKTLGKAAVQLKNGEFTATQFIDGIAAGLTGTGIMALGMLLSSLGIAVGGFDDDDEDKFRKLNGEQEYAIRIGDTSYAIDWAAPVVIPFFIGVAINEMSEAESNETILSNLGGLATAGLEPIINLSMLSGIQETIAAARYADADEIIYKVAGNVVGSYFTQSLPTIGGKVANTVDDTRRSNYIDKTSNVPTWLQSAVNTVKAKVPVLSSTRPEYIDAWGENKHTGSFIRRFFQNFLSPGYISEISDGELEKEITRLVKSTGEASVIPDNAPKYFKFKKNTKNLNAEEYELYASLRGGKAAEYVYEAIASKNYVKLTDAQKAEVISNIYKYCNAYAKANLTYTYDEVNLMYDG